MVQRFPMATMATGLSEALTSVEGLKEAPSPADPDPFAETAARLFKVQEAATMVVFFLNQLCTCIPMPGFLQQGLRASILPCGIWCRFRSSIYPRTTRSTSPWKRTVYCFMSLVNIGITSSLFRSVGMFQCLQMTPWCILDSLSTTILCTHSLKKCTYCDCGV